MRWDKTRQDKTRQDKVEIKKTDLHVCRVGALGGHLAINPISKVMVKLLRTQSTDYC